MWDCFSSLVSSFISAVERRGSRQTVTHILRVKDEQQSVLTYSDDVRACSQLSEGEEEVEKKEEVYDAVSGKVR